MVEYEGEVVGGGGIAPLPGVSRTFANCKRCIFFRLFGQRASEKTGLNGDGAGTRDGFKRCYLETTAFLKEAIALYDIWALSISTMRLAARAMSIVSADATRTLKKCPLVCAIGHFIN